MSTGTLQFFSGPDECLDILSEIVQSLGLHVILFRFDTSAFLYLGQAIDRTAVTEFGAERLYLTDQKPDMASLDQKNYVPGQLGWVDVDLPREVEGTLLLGVLGVKSDWYDPITKEIYDNRDVFNLYKKIRSKFKRKLNSPVWAYNIKSLKSSAYRDMGYTEFARGYVERGGELMQEGVQNIRFTLEEPSFN